MKKRQRIAAVLRSLEREDWLAITVCAVVFVGTAVVIVLLLGIHPYK
jgi:hypothetical protein